MRRHDALLDPLEQEFRELEREVLSRTCRHKWIEISANGDPCRTEICAYCSRRRSFPWTGR